MRQTITVLGASGSIGQSTLDVVRRHPDRYQVFALSAARSIDRMLEDIREFQPRYAVMADAGAAVQLSDLLGSSLTEVLTGSDALAMVASHKDVDMVMAAIVGAAGLLPTIAAAEAGKRVLLANKESLVMAGPLFMEAVRRGGATLLPIDSEHNAIFQSLPAQYDGDLHKNGIRKILLTASGGPFRGKTLSELVEVTPEQAIAHPNWSMGRKISVDSATLMNKGLELIEACFLFNCQPSDIQVVVHPQSVIHSMVQYCDGSVIAQLGQPDMRTPIAYGMAWPERIEAGVASLDLFEISRLEFCPPDHETFPCLALAGQAFAAGGSMPTVLNAANEIAVDAFLQEQIAFNQIPTLIRDVMGMHVVIDIESIDHVIEADRWARDCASQWISRSVA